MDLCVVYTLLLVVAICVREAVTSELVVSVPTVLEAKLGDDIKIPCKWRLADGEHLDPSSITLSWFYAKDQTPQTRLYYKKGPINFPENRDLLSFDVEEDFSLVIKSLRLEENIKFTCKVSSLNLGIKEATAQVIVFAEPEFEHAVTDKVVDLTQLEVNASVEIGTCILKNGHPKPSSITWYKSNVPVLHENITETVTKDSGKWTLRSTLRYRPTVHDHGSQFRCEASYHMPTKNVSTASPDATLTLKYPPAAVSMSVEPGDGTVMDGGEATLTCSADANPPPTYRFYKMPDRNGLITKGVNGNRLRLTGITGSHNGRYGCQVMWEGRPVSGLEPATSTITVSYRPVVTLKNESTEAKGWLRLLCTATGHPRPAIRWNPSVHAVHKAINETTVMQTIVISESAQRAGDIVCIANNTIGTTQTIIGTQQKVDVFSWLREMWKEASAIAGGAAVLVVACITVTVVCRRKCSRKKISEISTLLEVKPECANGREETAAV